MRQIAEAVGVSTCLVSKVLSGRLGKNGARESTIRAIEQKARELNYRRNELAVAFRTGRQNVLAVFVHRHGESGSGIVDQMVVGIAEEAQRHHQRLLLQYYFTPEEFRSSLAELHPNTLDGLIVGGISDPDLEADLRAWQQAGRPLITIQDTPIHPRMPNVGMEPPEIGRLATAHLITQGCRKIAYLRTRLPLTRPPEWRYGGYRRALAEAGLPYDPQLVVEAERFNCAAGRKATQALLERRIPFDGLVGESDQHAAAALNLLVAAGRRVPGEVKIIGVDDSPICLSAQVPLSSISQEWRVRGREGVRLLLTQVAGQEAKSVEITPVVKARGSTGVTAVALDEQTGAVACCRASRNR